MCYVTLLREKEKSISLMSDMIWVKERYNRKKEQQKGQLGVYNLWVSKYKQLDTNFIFCHLDITESSHDLGVKLTWRMFENPIEKYVWGKTTFAKALQLISLWQKIHKY